MISGQIIWLTVVQFAIFKGCYCLNETTVKEAVAFQNSSLLPKLSPIEVTTSSTVKTTINLGLTPSHQPTIINESRTINSTINNQNQLEVIEIFQGVSNITTAAPAEKISANNTIITDCLNVTSTNNSCIQQSWNDTIKTNYTTVAEAVGASEDLPPFRLQNTAAIAAGVFLVSAVLGYISCVGYRRFLQRKYGNSQILVGEENYDTTDLKYFEI